MKVLIIDNKFDHQLWGAEDIRQFGSLIPEATLHVRRGPQSDLPESPRPFDYIIVSGSKASAMEDAPWISDLHDFIRRAIDLGKPFLGICYGHQTLVRALGGKQNVRRSGTPEFGWTPIEITEPSELFKNLPQRFHSFSAHYEEVSHLPIGMTRLAKSDDCEIQACQLEGRPVFGVQFHPEKTLANADRAIREVKGSANCSYDDRRFDPKVGQTIFTNFFNYGKN